MSAVNNLLSFVLVVALSVVVLFGCGKTDDASTTTTAPGQDDSTTATPVVASDDESTTAPPPGPDETNTAPPVADETTTPPPVPDTPPPVPDETTKPHPATPPPPPQKEDTTPPPPPQKEDTTTAPPVVPDATTKPPPVAPSTIAGVSDKAPALDVYIEINSDKVFGGDSDAHGVHGIELTGGGLAVVGKSWDMTQNPPTGTGQGFLFVWKNLNQLISSGVLTSRKGYYDFPPDGGDQSQSCKATWGTTTAGATGTLMAAGGNQVLEIGEHLYVAGYEHDDTNSYYTGYLYKFKTSDCSFVWKEPYLTVTSPDTSSAYESIAAYGDGLVLGGAVAISPPSCIEAFKSAGTVTCGDAVLLFYTKSDLEAATPAQGKDKTDLLTKSFSTKPFVSVISVKHSAVNGGFALAVSTKDEQGGAIVHLPLPETDGSLSGRLDLGEQVSDIVVVGDHYFASGLGRIFKAKVDSSTGKVDKVWYKTYSPSLSGGRNQYSVVGSTDYPLQYTTPPKVLVGEKNI